MCGLFLKREKRNQSSQGISKNNLRRKKIWVDQGSEFYNNSFKDFLQINNIEMYSTCSEGKSAVAERFIRTLNTMKILIKKILNLKLVTMLQFQNTKIFLLKDMLQVGRKKFLLLVGLKIQFRGLMLLVT